MLQDARLAVGHPRSISFSLELNPGPGRCHLQELNPCRKGKPPLNRLRDPKYSSVVRGARFGLALEDEGDRTIGAQGVILHLLENARERTAAA